MTNGYALIGSSKVGRTLYLFKADGKLYKRNRNGFVKVLGNTYYLLKSGELQPAGADAMEPEISELRISS